MKRVLEKIKTFFVSIPSALKRINIRKINLTTILAFLSYLNILALVSFIFSKNKPYVRFHAKQGLVLLAFFGLALFSLYIPYLFWIAALFYALCVVFGIVNSFRGSERHLPLIGKLADRI
jgi:uncharacterized membrane protein